MNVEENPVYPQQIDVPGDEFTALLTKSHSFFGSVAVQMPMEAFDIDARRQPSRLESNDTWSDENNADDAPLDETPGALGHDVGKLSLLPLAVLVFYSVSGGPFGVEQSVRSAGNFMTLLGFLVMPLFWSLPEAWVTAELGTTFPEAAGGVAWVEEAFGEKAGFMSGYLGWLAGATDNAIYPVLFCDYLLQVVNNDGDDEHLHPVVRFLFLSGISITLAYVNWLGLSLVGNMSMVVCAIAMSPFVILSVVGAFKVDPSRWFLMPQEDVQTLIDAADDDGVGGGLFPNMEAGGILWRPFLNSLFWNLNSFDCAASFSADIHNPSQVLPQAMLLAVVMVWAGYFFPLLIALGASSAKQHEWVDGYFASISSEIVGPWLGAWTVFAAGISNIAQFQAELSADAYQLMGMSDRGYLPKIFSVRSRHGTPTNGILLGTIIILCMAVSHLDTLIEMLNFNYALSLLMEYAAFIKLRITRPDMHRPYKIPMNTAGCIVMLTPGVVMIIAILCLATYQTLLFSFCTNVVGLFAYSARKNSWFSSAFVSCKKYSPVKDSETDAESANESASTMPSRSVL